MRQAGRTQRLFILAEPRSGSSWLMETLNARREIQLSEEILNHVQNSEIKKYIGGHEGDFHDCLDYLERTLSAAANTRIRFSGCKILLNQLTLIGDRFPELFLDFYREASFVFLYRANLVAEHISLHIAHKHNIWHVKQKDQRTLKKVHISPPALVANLEKSLRRREIIREILNAGRLHCFPLSYEELFSEKENILAEIYAFLGMAIKKVVFSDEMKGNPFRPQEVIENYQEVRAYLKAYPVFLKMLLAE
jgi:LPS sulfotransferase NodH